MNLNAFAQRPAYDGFARLLHWLVALLVAAQFVIGWTMPDVHRDTLPNGLIAWHLGVGAAIVAAVACRIAWRATHVPQAAELSRALSVISSATHALLYALLVAVALAGWANASSRGWAVKLFGMIHYPDLTASGSPPSGRRPRSRAAGRRRSSGRAGRRSSCSSSRCCEP